VSVSGDTVGTVSGDEDGYPDGSAGADTTQRPFGLSTSRLDRAVVVAVSGELDLHSAPELMTVLDEHMRDPGTDLVVVDLTDVGFLGSSGLGVLANLATRATVPTTPAHGSSRPGARLRVVAPPDHRAVTRPWAAMTLQEILPLYPTVGSAVQGDLEP
jgi:anti-sigma B factor antagonist